MSALTWKRDRSRYLNPCIGQCKTQATARGVGLYRAEILGYPAGSWCERCRKEATKAWNAALNERVLEEAAV